MSPRPYRMGDRQAAVDQTKARIIAAARDELSCGGGFSVDAVAKRAGVARMTVYYQFGSRLGLLEALFDDLATRGGVMRVRSVFEIADPFAALDELIAVFSEFWATDRLISRRLRALSALDPDFEVGVRARDALLHGHIRRLLTRIAERTGSPTPDALDELTDVIHTIIGFESFDSLSGESRSREQVAIIVQHLARAAVSLYERVHSSQFSVDGSPMLEL